MKERGHPIALYPDEAALARAVVGPERVKDWPSIAQQLERRGFPRVHPLMGGRYFPAVLAFFQRDNGLPLSADEQQATIAPSLKPDGEETFRAPQQRTHQRRRRQRSA